MKTINIGILGFGTVGSGVYNILTENKTLINKRLKRVKGVDYNINIKKILVRNISKYNNQKELLTTDPKEIIEDNEIDIVCELIGGNTLANKYMKKSIDNQKHIVTANKKAIFKSKGNLIDYAKKNNKQFKYEGAVAGAIPIIKILEESFLGEEIEEVSGILNGSTNYILTKIDEGLSYEEAMKIASEKGYLEADPSSDIEGYDAMYKLGILGNIIYGKFPIEENIERIGIDKISKKELLLAKKEKKKIKLIGKINKKDGKLNYSVKPELINNTNPLYSVDYSLNGILLKCKNAKDIFLSGAGAGSRETAVSVVGDILSIIVEGDFDE